MADRAEQAEHAMSALMRFVVSLIIPLWALAMLVLGVEYHSLWWLGCGIAVGGSRVAAAGRESAGGCRARHPRELRE